MKSGVKLYAGAKSNVRQLSGISVATGLITFIKATYKVGQGSPERPGIPPRSVSVREPGHVHRDSEVAIATTEQKMRGAGFEPANPCGTGS